MPNILDYIDWRGDLPLAVSPFNEVDALILAELSYLDLDGVVSEDEPSSAPTLAEICEQYQALGRSQSFLGNDPAPTLLRVAACERFAGSKVFSYVNLVDAERELQLSAVSFALSDGTVCAAFRGTDNSLVGWREDFNFCYQSQTAGQREAALYLNRLAFRTAAPLRVTGHSKGGNFAAYAAAFCDPTLREKRLLHAYINDAPGFNRAIAGQPEWAAVQKKLHVVIPESSFFGVLLQTKEEKKLIRSDATGLYQHNPYSWQVRGTHFEAADGRSASSLFMDETIRRWMDSLDDSQRADFVQTFFDSLESAGVPTLSAMKAEPMHVLNATVSAIRRMPPELQRSAFSALGKLAAAGGGTLRDELKRALERRGIELLPGRRSTDG